jgi:monothiol glutaredoxin
LPILWFPGPGVTAHNGAYVVSRAAIGKKQRIKDQVTGHSVVLYMKGTPQMPQCGFSAMAIQVLQACGVHSPFTVNVLTDPDIREGIKHFANWPTIPQLYVNGEFVGGSDIMREM